MWAQFQKEADGADVQTFLKRLRTPGATGKTVRQLFNSLQCPSDLRDGDLTGEEAAVSLVQHLRLVHLNFDSAPMSSEGDAVQLCREALSSGGTPQAADLWRQLLDIAARNRESGGTLDLPSLYRSLRGKFDLRAHPDFDRDWAALLRMTEGELGHVHTDIAERVSLLRSQPVSDSQAALLTAQVLALVGDSGCGKSAMAKRLTSTFDRVVWLSARILDEPSLVIVERKLALDHPIGQLISVSPHRRALLVLDGVEGFSEQAIRNGLALLNQALHSPADSWRVVLTCQTDAWENMCMGVVKAAIGAHSTTVQLLSPVESEDVRAVLAAIPAARSLILRQEVEESLRNLQLLECVMYAVIQDPSVDTLGWVGVTDVIQWTWDHWTGSGTDRLARSAVLVKTAVEDTDPSPVGLSILDLSDGEREAIPALTMMRVLAVRGMRVYIAHEIVGDWVRLMVLQSDANDLFSRVGSVRWHPAIRLYGQWIAEHAHSSARWRELVGPGDASDRRAGALSDLMLESLAFAANSRELLEEFWPSLVQNNGHLLRRFLERFLHCSSSPNTAMMRLANDEETSFRLATVDRIPKARYWPAVLQVLSRHRTDCISLAPSAAARVCGLWLKTAPTPWPSRRPAADLAVALARLVQANSEERYDEVELAKEAYEAAMHAAPDCPDEVAGLALELSSRAGAPKVPRLSDDDDSILPLGRVLDPWPDGPRFRVDDEFAELCFRRTATLVPLMIVRPAVAREVLLALSIEPPRHEHYYGPPGNSYGTSDWQGCWPPFYFQGPFLQFLRRNPSEAVEAVVTLVNFATARWKKQRGGENDTPKHDQEVSILLGKDAKRWIGDATVYGWYSSASVGPHVVTSAMMALEKWLYELMDQKQPVESWVQTIMERSESVAFAGLLLAVGLKDVGLLLGPLQPLLSIWQIYHWEPHLRMDVNGCSMLDGATWGRWGERVLTQVREWRELEHRQIDVLQFSKTIMLSFADRREYFSAIRDFWRAQIAEGTAPDSLKLMIAQFDPGNYTKGEAHDGGVFLAEFRLPEDLRKTTEGANESAREGLLILGFPTKCRTLLDAGASLESAQIDVFWDTTRELASLRAKYTGHPHAAYVAAGVAGGIAVLFILHRNFLRTHAEREEWCIEQIHEVLQESPRPEFDHPDADTELTWEGFLAQFAAVWLSENATEPSVRGLAAACICTYHAKTTGLFLRQAFRLRSELGNEFVSLCNVALLWAALRWAGVSITWEIRNESIARWGARLIGWFIARRIPGYPLEWAAVSKRVRRLCFSLSRAFVKASASTEEITEDKRELLYRRTAPGLHPEVIRNAFAFAAQIDGAQSEEERAQWIRYLRQALDLTLTTVPTGPREDQTEKGTPDEFDLWILAQIAAVCAKVRPPHKVAELWHPIFNLGSRGHYWVRDFVQAWFIEGVSGSATSESFLQMWQEMLAYAEALGWTPGDKRAFRLQGAVKELLGWGFGLRTVAGAEFADVVSRLQPVYAGWGREWIRRGGLAPDFARFLSVPAASRLLPAGVKWLNEDLSQDDWSDDLELQDATVAVLRRCWREQQVALRDDRQYRSAFDGLLSTLVNLNSAGALELRDLINRNTAPNRGS